ncbi:hypothetical protein [Haloplanus sp. C73]|uniref:hypothetical protein n=1 Tax=Haloplanus sp. C73 TaxID=3421641 RepID=UPI003EBDFBE2
MASSISSLDSKKGADSLDDALSDAEASVAVVAPPFAGREAVLDRAADRLGAPTRVRFDTDTAVDEADTDGPVILDDCHHCYAHRIGGFDPLDRLLDRLASSSGQTVTSWNRHSWNYLDAVRGLADDFGHVFTVPALSTDDVADVVGATTDDWPAFELPPDGRSFVTSVEYAPSLPRSNRSVSVRVPTVDVDYVAARLQRRTPPTPEDLVFQRLARLADGNPGVATAIWTACVDGRETITPDDIALPVDERLTVGDDAARVLGVAVPKERVARAELSAVVPDVPLDRTLRTLADHGFVDIAEGVVRLRPGALPSAIDSLERRRWLW